MAIYILNKTIINNEIKKIKKEFSSCHKRLKSQYEKRLNDGGGLYLYLSTVNIGYGRWTYKKGLRHHIGNYNHYDESVSVSLEQARKVTAEIKEALNNGEKTTKVEKHNVIKTDTQQTLVKFSDIYLSYINRKKNELSENSIKAYTVIEKNLRLLGLWSIPAINFNLELVANKLEPLYNQNKHRSIKQTCTLINTILMYGNKINLIPVIPKIDISLKYSLNSNVKRECLEFSDVGKFFLNLKNNNSLNSCDKIFICLIFLTLCRKNEVLNYNPIEIELTEKYGYIWRIPASRMKANREFTVCINKLILNSLNWLYRNLTNKSALNTLTLNKYSLIDYPITIHGIRATGSTYLHYMFPEKSNLINLLLAHKFNESQADEAYNRYNFLSQKTELLNHWHEYLFKNTCIEDIINSIVKE